MDLELFYKTDENEKPLDHPVSDGGYVGIFRTIACVGDSMSSGEFESKMNGKVRWHDRYDYSWGQNIARTAGCKVYNFSKGGMTAQDYCESFGDQFGFFDLNMAAQAYIIALGANDILFQDRERGSREDICLDDWRQNKPSFYGFIAQIIQRYKEIQPRAKFFLVTIPDIEGNEDMLERAAFQRQTMYDMAELFTNTYVIDLYKYGPKYDEDFYKKFFVGGHMSATGYILTAKMIVSYIDYIIRHNSDEFLQAGFIGTNLHHEGAPWDGNR